MSTPALLLSLLLPLVALAGRAGAQVVPTYELGWSALTAGAGASGSGRLVVRGTVGQLAAGDAEGGAVDLTGGFWAIAPASCLLDLDGSGAANSATDIVYLTRHLFRLIAVPPSFRVSDPGIPADATIAARITAAGQAFDVDDNGSVEAATDAVYLARFLFGLPPVPPTFRTFDPGIPPDASIAASIDAACP